MVSAGSYLLGAAQLAILAGSLAWSAYRLRARFLPGWEGAPARLAESIIAVSLVTLLAEALGVFGLLYAGTLIASSVLVAAVATVLSPAGGGGAGVPRGAEAPPAPSTVGDAAPTGPAGQSTFASLVTIAVIALVFAHWGITAKRALDAGIFNFDSLWYHMPFAVEIAKGHSVTGMHYVDTVFTNWFYPQNSELLHGLGILLTGRDTLSLFLNFGWLALAFLAAWCIGRPYGRGHLGVVAAAVLLECHTLVVREPGAAKNDLMAAALLLAAIAVLVTAWNQARQRSMNERGGTSSRLAGINPTAFSVRGWELAVAGLAVGLAVGTKQTALAMAAALTLAVVVLAPAGRRWSAFAWWFLAALLTGGYWYLRDLIAAGNPIPQIESLGPLSLPHPERLQTGRPDFSVAHYATDTGVWREFFAPGLHTAFGALWPLVIAAAVLGAVLVIVRSDRVLRWAGIVALVGMLAYLVTPLSAAGLEGKPEGFGINIRYAIPALLAGIVLLPLPSLFDPPRRRWGLIGVLLALLLVSDRPDLIARDPGRLFALLVVILAVLVPAALLWGRGRGAGRGIVIAGFAALALAVVALGYPLQRHYLDHRFRNDVAADEGIPRMHLESAYRWARDREDTRIGLAGSSADFAGYGFYGTDLSNEVVYLGQKGPHGAFNAIPDCSAFRAAVNAAGLDYLVTSPFLNFIHEGEPIPSPEARWLRDSDAVSPVLRSGPVTLWRVDGQLDPAACGAANAPLREIPDTPGS